MSKTFLSFIEEQNKNKSGMLLLNEAFKTDDMKKALDLIDKVLSKHISGLVPIIGFVDTKTDGKICKSKQFLVLDKKDPNKSSAFQFNWIATGNSNDVYSIDFFKDANDLIWKGKAKSDLTLKTLGTSVVAFLPIIWTIVTSGDYDVTKKELLDIQKQIFKDKGVKESLYYIGALKYRIIENLNENIVAEAFTLNSNYINEAELSPELKALKKKKRADAMVAYAKRNNSDEDKETNRQLWQEYNEILAAIQGGATTIDELNVAIGRNVSVEIVSSESMQKLEEKITKERKDPDQVFKETSHYIKMVTNGLQPSLIICGAPGVGKTFRVKKQLKGAGYYEDEDGYGNMITIKGKCSPRALYLALYSKRGANEITLIDDADSLVGPHAPEDSINILKAALDSTTEEEGRLVTYGVAGKIFDNNGNEVPKRFYYKGGVIVLTNWNAGQLDTALRGRSFIQDIDFTTDDVLQIIKKLLPDIEPQLYTMEAKEKAFKYLEELRDNGSTMDLSLRTFGICVKMYQTADGDNEFTEEDARSMIKEQMRMQALRGGKKY